MPRLLPVLLTSGCIFLGNTTGTCEDVGVVSTGTIAFGDEEKEGTVDDPDLHTDTDGACVTAVSATLAFGQGCTMYVQADGSGERLAIHDVNLSGEEGCGLDGSGWAVADYRDSAILVAGDLHGTDSENTFCHDGTVTVELDLAVEQSGGDAVDVTGTLVATGVSYADVESARCE